MESTFMTIHSLTPQATILYASESIADILGFRPEDVTGRSCFEYFRPDEIPAAENIYRRAVGSDKTAALHYAHIRRQDGKWVGCECVLTVVYEILVAVTSICKSKEKNHRRAENARAIRRLFASSPRDPRYHMLVDLCSKLRTDPQASLFEPRAALIVNRFTRSLTIMYATNVVTSILGATPEQLKGKSMYEIVQGDCIPEAICRLEGAKANDSIAYLRFWRRVPCQDEDFHEEMREASQRNDLENRGSVIPGHMHVNADNVVESGDLAHPALMKSRNEEPSTSTALTRSLNRPRRLLGEGTALARDAAHATLDQGQASHSLTPSFLTPTTLCRRRQPPRFLRVDDEPNEIEAMISCTSDGLVVVLRAGRSALPS